MNEIPSSHENVDKPATKDTSREYTPTMERKAIVEALHEESFNKYVDKIENVMNLLGEDLSKLPDSEKDRIIKELAEINNEMKSSKDFNQEGSFLFLLSSALDGFNEDSSENFKLAYKLLKSELSIGVYEMNNYKRVDRALDSGIKTMKDLMS